MHRSSDTIGQIASALAKAQGELTNPEKAQPESFIEWLWTSDLIELSWEILRYRRFKIKLGASRLPPCYPAL
jgi:hypothetical protein